MASRLERGELVYFPQCPFALPAQADLEFLQAQRVDSRSRHIAWLPGLMERDRHDSGGNAAGVTGAVARDPVSIQRLANILKDFSHRAQDWLSGNLPEYARSGLPESATLRTEEVATRRLPFELREDLLHLDCVQSAPATQGRTLKLFVNICPAEARVWVTSDSLTRLLERFGNKAGLPIQGSLWWAWQMGGGLLRWFDADERRRQAYDQFLKRFPAFLKANDRFQERGPKRFWHMAPGSAWLIMSDGLAHADLRGKLALGLTQYINSSSLICPELAPAALLHRFCEETGRRRAA